MVREELIGKTRNGIEYIRGNKKVIFETGVVVSKEEFDAAMKLGTINNLLLDCRFRPDSCGYDYAYCKSTGVIRKKAVHQKKEDTPVNPVEPKSPDPIPEQKPQEEQPKEQTKRTSVNLFDVVYPVFMLLLALFGSCLSIYFTGVYMQRLQPVPIAFCISTCMLVYGLVGSQMTRRAFHSGQYTKAVIFGVTSVCVIGFSMYSSLDVNYARYVQSHKVIVEEEDNKQTNNLEFELLKEELASNKEQIEKLSKTYVVMWDAEKKCNVVVDGKITEKAQNQINVLTERNQEINRRLIELAQEGTKIRKSETESAASLTDLLGALLHKSGNTVQMFILLLPSIFIDLVNVLSITIYNDRFHKEEEDE